MHTEAIPNGDGQITPVGPDPLDYVLRYAACDYDCYHQGRYIGSRPTLQGAIQAIEEQQARAKRHPQPAPALGSSTITHQDELHAITARLQDLAHRLDSSDAEQASGRAQRTLAHIRITQAIRQLADAERSLALAERATDQSEPLDTAA
jgi:hypothetical protein